jgi:hypothetical protein
MSLRLSPDHYVPLDSKEYSLHPSAVAAAFWSVPTWTGRSPLLAASLHVCSLRLPARENRPRSWRPPRKGGML